jgi:putative Mn2+ efflux pump MntP
MSFASILSLAVGLAMDATAVAAARGLAVARVLPRHALLVAVFFGGSQALMPLFGWALGAQLGDLVAAWAPWIAFALLGGLGGKMLWEARAEDDDAPPVEPDPFALRPMAVLALATSVDAFAVGVTLPMLGAPLALSIGTIGLVTAALSVLGLLAGRRFGALVGKRLDALGGVVLVGLGAKILLAHLLAG